MNDQKTKPEIDYKFHPGTKMDYGIGIIGMGWVASNYHIEKE